MMKTSSNHSEQRSLKQGETIQQETQNMSANSMRVQTETYSAEKNTVESQQQRQRIMSGFLNNSVCTQEKRTQVQSNMTYTTTSILASSQSNHLMNGGGFNSNLKAIEDSEVIPQTFNEMEKLSATSSKEEVKKLTGKYSEYITSAVKFIKREGRRKEGLLIKRVNSLIRKAWAVPSHGHELGTSLCDILRTSGGLDLILETDDADKELLLSRAELLEQCLTTENRDYVVTHGLDKAVTTAVKLTNENEVNYTRIGTGILEHLFKHSEGTCSEVIKLGGLERLIFCCRCQSIEILRHVAGALANLSLYGGAENQQIMIKRQAQVWLLPLAFSPDDNVKYYACLAIAALVANKEIEAAVINSGTLNLVEPFVTNHDPSEFAKSNVAHSHGQSKHWLERFVPVLSSKREEARNLAAFHFCMEAGIKKEQNNTGVFKEIGAIEPLKEVASSPNAIASKFAVQALRLIGEEIPHKLSQQVPLWSVADVAEWVKQIGFSEHASQFKESRVDGDLLLQLTEDNLAEDIGIRNGIQRKRFSRELHALKKMADYSSRDSSNLNSLLHGIGPEFSVYTYSMLNAGVDRESIRNLSEDQLLNECGITNSIHRYKLQNVIREKEMELCESFRDELDKSLDVFVSYRRSNGSQLASLLKVHLQLRGFSVFIDVERLEAGKFDNNLLQSIRQAKHFLLVLTPEALQRCIDDGECKDWVHKEIVAALQSQCNIIPIIDNFQWPEPEQLPEDMRAVCHFNGIRWIHDYQDACVDKLERFMRGEVNSRSDGPLSRVGGMSGSGKGDVTPGTPSVVRMGPSYNRMHSNVSGEGSDGSKD